MKKYIHPKLNNTVIQTGNGAVYVKRWNFFKTNLSLDFEVEAISLWKNKKKRGRNKEHVFILNNNIIK